MELTIDFETRSAVDLKTSGLHRYAEDPSTDVICLAVQIDEKDPVIWVPSWVDPFLDFTVNGRLTDDELVNLIESAESIEAHNASFELALWNNVMVRYGFDALDPERVKCSAAMASMCALPRSLDGVAKALKLTANKDFEGRRIMLKMCKPRKPRKGEETDKTLWHEKSAEFYTLFEYCKQDVRTERAASWALYDLPEKERRVFLLDHKINERGIRFDLDSISSVIDVLEREERKLLAEMESICGIPSPRQVAKTKTWVEGRTGKTLTSLDKNAVGEILNTDIPDDVRRVLEIRTILGKSSTSKYKKMQQIASADGRGRGQFLYHGANTGRWAGKGIQPHNLPRGFSKDDWVWAAISLFKEADTAGIEMAFGDVFATASNLIRSMLIPDPGNVFRVGDFSSIEARKLAWLAGDENTLEVFMSGKDVYIHAASGIYKVPYDQVTDDQRRVGKVAVLALGYQGWIGAFQVMASAYGLDMDDDMAAETAGNWRETHPDIVSYWNAIENAAMQAVRNPGKVFSVKRRSFDTEVTVRFGVQNGWLQCILPSGRRLFYRAPGFTASEKFPGKTQLTYKGVDVNGQWNNIQTYGGKLVENITQASSRDILVDAMFRAEDAGYPIAMHVHDEIIAETPEDFGSNEELRQIMNVVPDWAPNMPVWVPSVWSGKRYRKD